MKKIEKYSSIFLMSSLFHKNNKNCCYRMLFLRKSETYFYFDTEVKRETENRRDRMKSRISKFLVGFIVALNALLPMNVANLLAVPEYIIVDDNVTDATASNYFTFSAASDFDGSVGWSDQESRFGTNELKTQHWVWNASNAEASKHSYSFTFEGTGVELVGITPTGSTKNSFQLDGEEAQTIAIDSASPTKESVIYSRQNLTPGKHTVVVTLPNDGTQKGLQISYARVYGSVSEANEYTTIKANQTEGEMNKFVYHQPATFKWSVSASEAYIDLGKDNSKVSEAYYEIPFVGNSIAMYANKSYNQGKVQFSIDGNNTQVVDLYAGSRTPVQEIYKVEGLSEGAHTLKAVLMDTKSGTTFVNQVVSAKVGHAPYAVEKIELETKAYTLREGAKQQINFTVTPSYAKLDDVTYHVETPNIASVSESGEITAKEEGSTTINVISKKHNISESLVVTVHKAIAQIGGSIVDTDTQYTQNRYDEVKQLGMVSDTLTAWKNDKAISELSLYSKESSLKNVKLTATDLTSDKHTIASSNVKATYIKSTEAYNGGYLGYGSPTRPLPAVTETNRSESNDILYQDASQPINIGYNQLQNVWLEFAIPKDAVAGTYTTTLTVQADGIEAPLTFEYTVVVQDATLKDAVDYKDGGFDIELWQYPYSIAEYYEVTPFSDEHLELMRSSMMKYKEIGGHAITASIIEDAWAGQTYSENSVHYPSMVKWTKNTDGSFT